MQEKLLIIQTAFIGDAILATACVESLHKQSPDARIDVVVRKGNESFFEDHPKVNQVFVWDKQNKKKRGLFRLGLQIRKTRYDHVFNLQRFASTGILTTLIRSKKKWGFDKNPFAFLFSGTVRHEIGNGKHEVERNTEVLALAFPDIDVLNPKLYPNQEHYSSIKPHLSKEPFVTMSPASVWETKKWPKAQFIKLINKTSPEFQIFLLGGPGDKEYCEEIKREADHPNVDVLAGRLSLLASTALMEYAKMNYVNDSAPLHLASAMNAPVCAFFCSTDPKFGFTPLSEVKHIIVPAEAPPCHPCGLHGFKACPETHFKCGTDSNWDLIPIF